MSIDSKVELLPHCPGFLMRSGGSAWTPAIIAMAGFFARETDELFVKIEWILPQVVTKFSRTSEVPMGRALFGGWLNSRNSMRLGCVFSDEVAAFDQENQDSGEVSQPDAFQLHEFDGDHRMDRNYLAHRHGDLNNAVLAAVGYNFRRLIRWLRSLLCLILGAIFPKPKLSAARNRILHRRRVSECLCSLL